MIDFEVFLANAWDWFSIGVSWYLRNTLTVVRDPRYFRGWHARAVQR